MAKPKRTKPKKNKVRLRRGADSVVFDTIQGTGLARMRNSRGESAPMFLDEARGRVADLLRSGWKLEE